MSKVRFFNNNYLILILLFLFLSSCSTTYKVGKAFNVENIYKIKVGVTTQNEALKLFGNPLRIGASNGDIVFTYAKEDITFSIINKVEKKGNTLILEFDENKILKNYYWNIPGKDFVLLKHLQHERSKDNT